MLVPNCRDAFLTSPPILEAASRQVADQAKRLSLGQSDRAAVRRIGKGGRAILRRSKPS